ncbi:MAG: hypothetical protein QG614_448 [Patescibacteria group bacterium]|nr:hypothetical protein [Patescibacteria group bacterium]
MKNIFQIVVYFFALTGLAFLSVFFAMKYGLTKTTGSIDSQSSYFKNAYQKVSKTDASGDMIEPDDYCIIKTISISSNSDLERILKAFTDNHNDIKLLYNMLAAYKYSWTENDTNSQNFEQCINQNKNKAYTVADVVEFNKENKDTTSLLWANTSEWQIFEEAILKDKEVIDRVSQEVGVDKRFLITPLVVEQLRLFSSQREIFKKYFAPLRILGSQTQFSLGIYGIKEETAKQIERNLKDKNSSYYLGVKYENILDIKADDNLTYTINNDNLKLITSTSSTATSSSATSSTSTDSVATTSVRTLNATEYERIKRLTDEHDHYYSYLYAALYIKELATSWQKAGYDISDRPEIIATLYNIGFAKSNPKPNPEVGGAIIDVGTTRYTFGSLAYQFYYSGLLSQDFGYPTNK